MFDSGNKIISDALASFQQISTQLDNGIRKSSEEATATNTKLEEKRAKFKEVEDELLAKTTENADDIARAINVKNNLTKILTGTL